jgi:cytochrome c553
VKPSLSLAAVCLVAAPHLVAAAGADIFRDRDERARDLAATCTGCHGTDGRSSGDMSRLAREPKERLLHKLRAFRSGRQPATVMHQIARGYSDDELRSIAGYFAAQPRGQKQR